MLPGRDGLEVLRALRPHSAVPVLMLTARVEEVDRLLGLELGADDYICKPFSPRAMVEQIQRVLGAEAKVENQDLERAGIRDEGLGVSGLSPKPYPLSPAFVDVPRREVE